MKWTLMMLKVGVNQLNKKNKVSIMRNLKIMTSWNMVMSSMVFEIVSGSPIAMLTLILSCT
jgi:hypothetical protein